MHPLTVAKPAPMLPSEHVDIENLLSKSHCIHGTDFGGLVIAVVWVISVCRVFFRAGLRAWPLLGFIAEHRPEWLLFCPVQQDPNYKNFLSSYWLNYEFSI